MRQPKTEVKIVKPTKLKGFIFPLTRLLAFISTVGPVIISTRVPRGAAKFLFEHLVGLEPDGWRDCPKIALILIIYW